MGPWGWDHGDGTMGTGPWGYDNGDETMGIGGGTIWRGCIEVGPLKYSYFLVEKFLFFNNFF